jgi:hypothetical protein
MPVSALTVGSGLLGVGQALFSGKNKRQADLENYEKQTPMYSGGQSINDYYQKALSRYNVNPYSSPLYAMQMQNAQRATNQGLQAASDRRGGLGMIGKLTGLQDDATLKAAITAENDQSKRLAQLGGAANALTQNQKYTYQNNQLNPYLRQLQLKNQQASGAANVFNAGLSNVFGSLSSGALLANGNAQLAKKLAAGVGSNVNGATAGTTAKVDSVPTATTTDPYADQQMIDTDPYATDNNSSLNAFYRQLNGQLNKRTKFGMGGGN